MATMSPISDSALRAVLSHPLPSSPVLSASLPILYSSFLFLSAPIAPYPLPLPLPPSQDWPGWVLFMLPLPSHHLLHLVRHLFVPVVPPFWKVRVLLRPPLYGPGIHPQVLPQLALVHPVRVLLAHQSPQRLGYRPHRHVLHPAGILLRQRHAQPDGIPQIFLSFHLLYIYVVIATTRNTPVIHLCSSAISSSVMGIPTYQSVMFTSSLAIR